MKLRIATNKALPLFTGNQRFVVMRSGRGCGKSWAIAQAIIYHMYSRKVFVFCARYIQKSIKDSVYKILQDTANRIGVARHFKFLKTEIQCRATGSVCVFGGLRDNLISLKGLEGVDICWVEEAECVTEEAWDFLIPSIRKAGSRLFISFNPRYETDDTWKRFVLSTYPNSINIELDECDNPHFPEDLRVMREFDRLTNPRRYEWIWLGKPLAQDSDTLIPKADISAALQRVPVVDKDEPIIMGVDPALEGSDPMAIVVRRGAQLISVREYPKTNTNECERIILDSVAQWNPAAIIMDSCGLGAPIFSHVSDAAPFKNWIRFNGANSTADKRHANRRARSWDRMREWIYTVGSLRGMEHVTWENEFNVRWKIDNQGRMLLESKQEMARRNVRSPNVGDALAMTFEAPRSILQAADNRDYNRSFIG